MKVTLKIRSQKDDFFNTNQALWKPASILIHVFTSLQYVELLKSTETTWSEHCVSISSCVCGFSSCWHLELSFTTAANPEQLVCVV